MKKFFWLGFGLVLCVLMMILVSPTFATSHTRTRALSRVHSPFSNPWQVISSLNTPRGGKAVIYDDYIYEMGGGNNSGTKESSVEYALVNPDGTLGTWNFTSPMVTDKNHFAVVVWNGFLYVVGGIDLSNTRFASIERAEINPDGSLGTWQVISSMTTPRAAAAAVVANGFLYAIGGGDYSGPLDSIERAAINPDGSLGSWSVIDSLTMPLHSHAAVTSGNYLYVLGGSSGFCSCVTTSVERALINPDGSLGSWVSMTSLENARYQFGAVAVNGSIFALGGDNGSIFVNNEMASINLDGSLGSWQTIAQFNTPRSGPAIVTNGNFLYGIGGADNSGALGSVERAPVDISPLPTATPTPTETTAPTDTPVPTVTTTPTSGPSPTPGGPDAPVIESYTINGGSLTTTTTNVSLLLAYSDPNNDLQEVSISNDNVSWSDWDDADENIGWTLTNGDGAKTVYARARDALGHISEIRTATITLDTTVESEFSVSINNGALYTNQIGVTLKVGAKSGTSQMQVSNDGGFVGAVWEPYTSTRTWQITEYDGSVIPRTVYVRYKDSGGNVVSTASDDIILDVQAPTGSVNIGGNGAAEDASAVKLNLSASDDLSGVGGMRLSNRSDFQGADWLAYTATKNWTFAANQVVFVQFRDNAGNISRTYSTAACNTKPSAPELKKPKNGGKAKANPVNLDWNDSQCGANFSVVVRVNSSSGKTVSKMNAAAVTQFTTKTLAHGKTYYWQVQVCNNKGCTVGSWWSFKIPK